MLKMFLWQVTFVTISCLWPSILFCEAADGQNSATGRSKPATMTTMTKKSLLVVKSVAGQSVQLNCPLLNLENAASLNWLKGSTKLPVNKRQEVFENGTLVLRDVQKVTEDGIYTCSIEDSNSSSSKSAAIRLVILVGPMIVPFEFPKSIQQGMRARLLCSIMSGDPPFTYSWFKDGKKLEPGSLSLGLRTDEFSTDLTFHRLTTRHNGNYTCQVTNDVASISHSTQLLLDVPPFWKIEPKDVSVIGGQSIMIDCAAEGWPAPSITWERGSSMDSSPRYYSVITSGPHFEVHSNGSLLVKNPSEEDSGNYLCQASNSIGPGISKLLTLTVHVAPRFTSKFQSESVKLGEKISLKCEAIGDNPMTIKWKMSEGHFLRTDDPRFERREEMSDKKIISTLNIETVQRKDSSLFTCIVSNEFGVDEMNIRLIVQEAPESPRDVKCLEVNSRSAKLNWNLGFNGNNQITKFWITCHPKEPFYEVEERRRKQAAASSSPSRAQEGKEELSFSSGSSLLSSSLSSPLSSGSAPMAGHVNVSVDSVSADDGNMAVIRGLKPATKYQCSVRAENDIGISQASHHVELVTEEEAPGGPPVHVKGFPIDARSINVTWRAPDSSTWNGILKGYYIGYKKSRSNDQYLYKTLEILPEYSFMGLSNSVRGKEKQERGEEENDASSAGKKRLQIKLDSDLQILNRVESVSLSGLKPFTEYTILVQAYNSMGAGPRSDEVTIQTEEDVPSSAPGSVECSSPSSESLLVTWQPPASESLNGILKGFKVSFRPLGGDLGQSRDKVTNGQNEIKLTNLLKFTNYSLEVRAFNRKGSGLPSKAIYCRTLEDVPGIPVELKAVISSPDSVIVTWKDPLAKNGLITKYTLYWRDKDNLKNKNRTKSAITVPKSRTNVFSTRYRVLDSHPQYKLTGLSENQLYEVWVTASTRVGEGSPTRSITFRPLTLIPAQILELSDTWTLGSGDFVPFVLACHVVGSEPLTKSWTKNGKEELKMEPDGSLFIQSLETDANYTCSASNNYGFDSITYHLIKEIPSSKAPISIKVTSSSFTTARVTIYRDLDHVSSQLPQARAYELYYRMSISSGADSFSNEWQVKPIFTTPAEDNQTILLDNLICGTSYHVNVADLDTGTRTETTTFRTQGSAPIAPKREQVLRLVNDSAVFIYPSAWDQSAGCPIVKLTIEYRSMSQPTWKLVSSQALSDEVIELTNLTPKTIYAIRMTAHTKGSPSTMAEYEARLGLEEEYFEYTQRGILDTTTLISLVSSCVVLMVGCIAVFCLIVYKRKLNQKLASRSSDHYRRQSSSTSAASLGHDDTNDLLRKSMQSIDTTKGILVNKDKGHLQTPGHQIQQVIRVPAGDSKRVMYPGSPARGHSHNAGKLPNVSIPKEQLEQLEAEIYNEYEEINPYASFKKEDICIGDPADEEFKTFTMAIGEPAYCFKGVADGKPMSRDFTLASYSKCREMDTPYQTYGPSGYNPSIASSNQTELIRAYDYGKRYQHHVQTHHHYFDEDEDGTMTKSNLSLSDTDPPTDPGIRKFTKSPPRPNEKRVAGCFTSGQRRNHRTPMPVGTTIATDDDSDENEDESEQVTDEDEKGESERVHDSGTSTCSTTSDDEEEDTRDSETPTNTDMEAIAPKPTNGFGAIPRDRSRRPSWALTPNSRNQRFKVASSGLSTENETDSFRNDKREERRRSERRREERRKDSAVVEDEEDENEPVSSDSESHAMISGPLRDRNLKEKKKKEDERRKNEERRKEEERKKGFQAKNSFQPLPTAQGHSSSSGHQRQRRPPLRTKSTVDEIEC